MAWRACLGGAMRWPATRWFHQAVLLAAPGLQPRWTGGRSTATDPNRGRTRTPTISRTTPAICAAAAQRTRSWAAKCSASIACYAAHRIHSLGPVSEAQDPW